MWKGRNYCEGAREQAITALQQAVEDNPDLISPRTLLGQLYRSDGEYQQAVTQYQNLVRLDPYTVSNHYYLGLCYHFLNRLTEGSRYTGRPASDPQDFKSEYELGLVVFALGENAEAVHYLHIATQINPKSAPAWSNYAVALDAMGDYPHAEECYRRSLELDADNTAALLDFGTNLLLQNKTTEAIAILAPLSKRLNTPMVHKRPADFSLACPPQPAEYHSNLRHYPALNALLSPSPPNRAWSWMNHCTPKQWIIGENHWLSIPISPRSPRRLRSGNTRRCSVNKTGDGAGVPLIIKVSVALV